MELPLARELHSYSGSFGVFKKNTLKAQLVILQLGLHLRFIKHLAPPMMEQLTILQLGFHLGFT